MRIFFIFTILVFASFGAHAQDNLEDNRSWKELATEGYLSNGASGPNGSILILEKPQYVHVVTTEDQPIIGYSNADWARGKTKSASRPGQFACEYTSMIDGDIVNVTGTVVAIRFKNNPCASALDSSGKKNNIFYFRVQDIDPNAKVSDRVLPKKKVAAIGASGKSDLLTVKSKTQAPVPVPPTPSDGVQSEIVSEPPSGDIQFDYSGTKTAAELEKYLNSHCTKFQPDYQSYYKEIIEISEKTMTVGVIEDRSGGCLKDKKHPHVYAILTGAESNDPGLGGCFPSYVSPQSAVIKCLMMRESQWNLNAKSGTNAMGLGQQTETNVVDISQALYGDKKLNVSPKAWAKPVFENALKAIEKRFPRAENPQLYTNSNTGRKCDPLADFRGVTTKNAGNEKRQLAYCPVTSILAVAFYQMEAEVDLRVKIGHESQYDISQKNPRVFKAFIGLMQNVGRGAGSLIGMKQGIDSWMGAAANMQTKKAREKEVAGYSKVVQNCISPGVDAEMSKGEKALCGSYCKQKSFSHAMPISNADSHPYCKQFSPSQNAGPSTQGTESTTGQATQTNQ